MLLTTIHFSVLNPGGRLSQHNTAKTGSTPAGLLAAACSPASCSWTFPELL